MNFDWTPKEKEFKSAVASVLDVNAVLDLESLEHADVPEIRTITLRYMRKLAEVGYLTAGAGPEGRNEILALMAGQEELAGASNSLFLAIETTARLFGGLVKHVPSNPALSDMFRLLERGQLIAAVALSESEPSGQVDYKPSMLSRKGEHYTLTGRKSFVTNGPIADVIAVVTDPDQSPRVALLNSGVPAAEFGPRLKTVGHNGLAVASLTLNSVRVSEDMILGPFSDWDVLEFLRQTQNLILTMASVGLMRSALDAAKRFSDEHKRGGKPVFRFQEIRFKIAEMLTLLQTAQLLAYRAGWLYSAADPEAGTMIHCAKVFSSEAAEQVTSIAMQIVAGHGYVAGNRVEQAYREAKYAPIAGTTSELARMAIAEDLLQRYKV